VAQAVILAVVLMDVPAAEAAGAAEEAGVEAVRDSNEI